MSIYKNGKLVAGGSQALPLLSFMWADHILDDISWLRADTFSWQSGAVYQAAFNELFYDIQISTYWYGGGGPAYTKSRTPAVGDAVYLNSDLTTQIGTVEAYDDANDEITVSGNTYTFMSNTYVTPTTETVAGYSVSVYTGHSGRKIVNVSDETNVANIYTATGVAWYYIIDIPNKRFKLPRSKHEHYGNRPVIGNGISLGLTTGDGNNYGFYQTNSSGTSTAKEAYNRTLPSSGGNITAVGHDKVIGVSTDPDKSGIISTPVQDTDQYKYLYFYVGKFTQTALENTAGLNTESFNEKADLDLANVLANIDFVVERQEPTAENDYTWYRKYRSGWVEQGGVGTLVSSSYTANFPVEMADTNYFYSFNAAQVQVNTAVAGRKCTAKTTTFITILGTYASGGSTNYDAGGVVWEVKGMAA